MTEEQILSDVSAIVADGAKAQADRPVIIVSYAQSLDGCLTRRQGTPYPLSGEPAMRVTHGIRERCDGLLAGIGTVLADDPKLTTRYGFSGDPEPIILDSRLRFPLSAKLLSNAKKPLIATLSPSKGAGEGGAAQQLHAQEALAEAGATVWSFAPNAHQRIPLPALLTRLYRERHIRSIMVEGGAKVIAEFLNYGLCDYLVVTIAPIFLANQNAVSLALSGTAHMPTINGMRHSRLGKDLIVWGQPSFDRLL